MIYKYIPNTYDKNKILEKSLTKIEFLKYQTIYRKSFETLINQIIDFEKLDEYIENIGLNIPMIYDKEYNFYHKYSTLKSKYIYMRNNIHVENLNNEELKNIQNCINENKILSKEFIYNTYKKVLFEKNKETFIGEPNLKNKINSQSLIFEFCYNTKKCISAKQILNIERTYEKVFLIIEEKIKNQLNIPVSMFIYDFITDLYIDEDVQKKYYESQKIIK